MTAALTHHRSEVIEDCILHCWDLLCRELEFTGAQELRGLAQIINLGLVRAGDLLIEARRRECASRRSPMAPLDVRGTLEHAGADRDAPAGSLPHALAQVSHAVENLIEEARRCVGGTGDLADLRIALERLEG